MPVRPHRLWRCPDHDRPGLLLQEIRCLWAWKGPSTTKHRSVLSLRTCQGLCCGQDAVSAGGLQACPLQSCCQQLGGPFVTSQAPGQAPSSSARDAGLSAPLLATLRFTWLLGPLLSQLPAVTAPSCVYHCPWGCPSGPRLCGPQLRASLCGRVSLIWLLEEGWGCWGDPPLKTGLLSHLSELLEDSEPTLARGMPAPLASAPERQVPLACQGLALSSCILPFASL